MARKKAKDDPRDAQSHANPNFQYRAALLKERLQRRDGLPSPEN